MSDQPLDPQATAPQIPSPVTQLPQDLSSVSQGMLGTPAPAAPIVGGPRQKELGSAQLVEAGSTVASPEAPTPKAEIERSPEMGPELEKFVEQLEKQKKAAAETVIAAQTMPDHVPKTISQPVVILPLTEKLLKNGQRKNTTQSVRWLAEWCVRQIKKFRTILVVYRENE